MELTVYSIDGQDTGRKIDLNDKIFGLEAPRDHLIYQDVRLIQANRRQGTHKSKERGEVSGSKKKPYRQKGTGNARAGHKRSPLWRHGGTIFGPRPRDYSFRLNKKQKKLARKSALTYKAQEEGIKIVENFTFEAPKTRQFVSILDNLELAGKKILFVQAENDTNVFLSGRNIPKTEIRLAKDLNTYDIINADHLLITEEAVNVINEQMN